jgi:hypothetical protein
VGGTERVVELPPRAAGDDGDAADGDAADDGRVPLGVWLGGTVLPVAVGLPGDADPPGPEESSVLIGAAPVARLADVDPAGLGGVVTSTAMPIATTATTTRAAQAPRRANNRRPRVSTFLLPVTAEQGARRLPRAWPPAQRPPVRYATVT